MQSSEEIIAHLSKDPKLASIIAKVGEPKLRIESDYYKSLVESIVSQQLSVKAADAIFAKFLAVFEIGPESFPDPVSIIEMSPDRLREAGLSYRKIEYVKDLAVKISDGELNFATLDNLDDEKVIEVLSNIRGIGRWTAQMFLMFSMGREDVLPTGDLGIKKAFMNVYEFSEMPTEEQMIDIAEKWKPYRSIASWYLWQSLAL